MKIRNSKFKIRNPQKGFTLVETIVSLGILLLGAAATLTLVTTTLSYSRQTENLVVVVNLAREGLELVRVIRDVQGFVSLPAGNTAWIIDRTSTSLTTSATFSGGSTIHDCTNCTLYLNNNEYQITPGTATAYRRLININTLSTDEKEIISTLRWTEHGRVHTYQLATVLTNWK